MTNRISWIALHFVPLIAVPLITHALIPLGINTAAAVALLAIIGCIAFGQSRLIRKQRVTRARWMWQTACALGLAVAAGLVTMSTVDLAGYDVLATFSGMSAAGLVFGIVQAPMLEKGKLQWTFASIAGWLIGALAFRSVITSLVAMSIGDFTPYALAYNAGHNELLWTATGLAVYGFVTQLKLDERHVSAGR